MGYIRDASGRLCCDDCGRSPARKRSCPVTVPIVDATGRTFALPYCPATALCDRCWTTTYRASWRTMHGPCADAARTRAERTTGQETLAL